MDWQNIALGLAGAIGCCVAVVHGFLIERLVARQIGKLVAADTRLAPAIRRLLWPLLHLSTFAWFLGGLALIGAAVWLEREAQFALGMFVGSLYLYGAVANLQATRRFHPGWVLMVAALVLIAAALIGSGS
jgi:hypothetical protein